MNDQRIISFPSELYLPLFMKACTCICFAHFMVAFCLPLGAVRGSECRWANSGLFFFDTTHQDLVEHLHFLYSLFLFYISISF